MSRPPESKKLAAFIVALVTVSIAVHDSVDAATPVEVSTCGQLVSKQAGFLAGPLDCTGFAGNAVTIVNGSLDLRGFTLTGGDGDGIHCDGRCDIFSVPPGGTITGAKHDGIEVGSEVTKGKATITDIVITGNGSWDTFQLGAIPPDSGVVIWNRARLIRVTVSNVIGHGAIGNNLGLEDCQIIDNEGDGFLGGRAKIIASTIAANGGDGINADRITLSDSLIEGNGFDDPFQNGTPGPAGLTVFKRIKASNIIVRQNHRHGIELWSAKLSLADSEITDNSVSGPGFAGIYGLGAKSKLQRVTISGNGVGIGATNSISKIEASVISNNGVGIAPWGGSTRVYDSEIRDNATYGVHVTDIGPHPSLHGEFKAVGTNILGNGTADISAESAPAFVYAPGVGECEHSIIDAPGTRPHWGVCSLDCTNGVLNPGEACDGGPESATCDDDCTVAECGDWNVNKTAGEECEDGNTVSEDGCDANCIVEFCGDFIAQAGLGEVCDTGGVFTATCDDDCSAVVCGDGRRNRKAGEQCDDFNVIDGDGCSSTCKNE